MTARIAHLFVALIVLSFIPILAHAAVITATAGAGGSISPSGAVSVTDSSDQAFTITPDTGYHVADVLVDGSSVGAVSSYTFTNVTSDHTISASFAINTYTITAAAGGGGSISPSGAVSVTDGSDQAFTITPDTGYHVADVLVDGASVGAVSNYTFTNVTSDHTISASFAINTYTITAAAGGGGSISPSGAVSVTDSSDQAFTITPNSGYHVADVLVDGASVGAVSSYTFSNVTTNHTISASFTINTYTITATAGSGGSISPSGDVAVSYGGNQAFTITPNSGYHVADVLVDGASIGTVSSHTFTNVTANHTISASFAINTYTITSSAGAGGSIDPVGITTVAYGSDQAFTITPSTGYHVAGVLVDGASVGTVSSYTFSNVTTSHTISASFAINAYTITATAGSGGNISPSGVVGVSHGGNQAFTITPNTGYHVSDVLVDGASIGTVSSHTFTNVTANHTISASFAISNYTITATAGSGGRISPSGVVGVSYGGNQAFTITPSTGYHVAGVLVDGASVGTVLSHTFTNVTASHTISAHFTINTYTITANAGSGGNISPSGVVGVSHGGNQAFTIMPNTGYHVADVLVDGVSIGAVSSHTFTNVTTSHTISASFAITTDKYTLKVDISGDGSVVMDPEGETFNSGTQVNLIASPLAGWVFDSWNGDLTGSVNPVTITMNVDKTIEAVFLEDSDLDGTPNVEEQGPDRSDNSYDGNNDGIPDWTQANVVSRHARDDNYYLTIASPQGTAIVDLMMTELPEGAPANYKFPYGLISFEVSGIAPGGTTTVEVILPQGETCGTYFKYDETNDTWSNFFYHFDDHTGAVISGNVIILHFIDKLRGDQDGIANGIIMDPGTPAIRHQNDPWYQQCFISMADTPYRINAYAWVIILFFGFLIMRSDLLFQKRRIER